MHLTCTWCPLFAWWGYFSKATSSIIYVEFGVRAVCLWARFLCRRVHIAAHTWNRAALFTWTSAKIAFHLNLADHILPEGEDRSAGRVWLIAADDFFLNSGEGSLASCLSLRVQNGKQEQSWRAKRHFQGQIFNQLPVGNLKFWDTVFFILRKGTRIKLKQNCCFCISHLVRRWGKTRVLSRSFCSSKVENHRTPPQNILELLRILPSIWLSACMADS